MRHLILSSLFVAVVSTATAQIELGAGLGGSKLYNNPDGVELQSSFSAFLYLKKEINVNEKLLLEPFIRLNINTFFIDGHFTETSGKRVFMLTPSNYKQSRINLTSVSVPILLKWKLFNDSEKQGIAIGAGPYFDFLINAKQLYKIERQNYSNRAPIDNKVNAGFLLDFGTTGKQTKQNVFGFGAGVQFQFTNWNKEENSFKPLNFYLRLGVPLYKR